MNILWFSWKDIEHPQAGGAEVVKYEICKRLVADGHNVLQLVGGFRGAESSKEIDGCQVVRVGGRYTVYIKAWLYYRSKLRGWADLVIDECNTIPYFASKYVSEPNVLLIYQLAREVWFHQMKAPFSWMGYFLEPLYIKLLRSSKVLTICESTKRELLSLGFNAEEIHIIRMGSELNPVQVLPNLSFKKQQTLLYLGSLREMKRPDHVVEAFRIALKKLPQLRLIVAGAGSGAYFDNLVKTAQLPELTGKITFTGRVSIEEKMRLMQQAELIAVASVKEGWGLIVTEAASQGTPAVVYDVDGLRDSVRHRVTGLVTACTPAAMAEGIIEILTNQNLYLQCRKAAWEWSKELNFDNTYRDFCAALEIQ